MNIIIKQARKICDTVLDHAERYSLNVSVVVVDNGGHLIAMYRTDRASYTSIEAARRKAVTSSALQMPTSALVHMFENDPLVVTALTAGGEMLVVPGGFPLVVDGNCRGGFGIAGGHYSEDEMLGSRTLDALAPETEAVA